MPSLYTFLAGLTVVCALFVVTAHNQLAAAVTLFLIGAFGFARVPAVQTRLMDQAAGAPTMAAAANHSTFNIANARRVRSSVER
jgi:DHA1 family inner membrane transport protein